MSRTLNVINLIGVLLLASLCAFQWRQNSGLNLRVITLEQTGREQASKLSDQAVTLKQNASDLEDLRDRLERAGVALHESESKLAATIAERERLLSQKDQLEQTLKKWEAAVAARDELIKKAGAEIETLAAERNNAIQKFNDLAGKYNALVKQASSGR